jgi:hypothetical protein
LYLTFNVAYSFRFLASPFWFVKGKFLIHYFKLRCRPGMTHNVKGLAVTGISCSVSLACVV